MTVQGQARGKIYREGRLDVRRRRRGERVAGKAAVRAALTAIIAGLVPWVTTMDGSQMAINRTSATSIRRTASQARYFVRGGGTVLAPSVTRGSLPWHISGAVIVFAACPW